MAQLTAVAFGAVVLAMAVGGAVWVASTVRRTAATTSASVPNGWEAAVSALPPLPSASSVPATPTPPEISATDLPTAATQSPPQIAAPRPTATAVAQPTTTSSRATTSAATPATTTPSTCKPPYTIDPVTGQKHFKAECL